MWNTVRSAERSTSRASAGKPPDAVHHRGHQQHELGPVAGEIGQRRGGVEAGFDDQVVAVEEGEQRHGEWRGVVQRTGDEHGGAAGEQVVRRDVVVEAAGVVVMISFGTPVLPPDVAAFHDGLTTTGTPPSPVGGLRQSSAGDAARRPDGRRDPSPTTRAASVRSTIACRSTRGRRCDTGSGVAPAFRVASATSMNSTEFGRASVTIRPSPTPAATSRRASRSVRSSSTSNVSVRSPTVRAGASGRSATRRRDASTIGISATAHHRRVNGWVSRIMRGAAVALSSRRRRSAGTCASSQPNPKARAQRREVGVPQLDAEAPAPADGGGVLGQHAVGAVDDHEDRDRQLPLGDRRRARPGSSAALRRRRRQDRLAAGRPPSRWPSAARSPWPGSRRRRGRPPSATGRCFMIQNPAFVMSTATSAGVPGPHEGVDEPHLQFAPRRAPASTSARMAATSAHGGRAAPSPPFRPGRDCGVAVDLPERG